MIEEILKSRKENPFDFRDIACPTDPCRPLFAEWVDYYRLKSSIARVMKPASILEVGVRYGYSAAAFFDGHPATRYTGIDADDDSFGGVPGAIEWARKVLPPEKTVLIRGNTQEMDIFPGGLYDLIHLDGQQDGDGTFNDLEKAVRQGRFLLVDGFLWTSSNFQSANEFLRRNAGIIEYYWVIPGYAGELLIHVADRFLEEGAKSLHPPQEEGSLPLRDLYTTDYYMNDCGGWDTFKKTGGCRLVDARLASVLDLVLMPAPSTVLDLGCGRGEITLQAAAAGCAVTAIDYSPHAIAIARKAFTEAAGDETRVTWIRGDASSTDFNGSYDVAVAGDLVEHMAPCEVERLYQNVARHLAPEGIFIVHTFPNKWYYQYDYERRRRLAASIGAYLPPEPRTRYERQMHINEQSPRELKKQLEEHFKHVLLWFGSPENPGASLLKPHTPRELAAERDLYAIASQHPIDPTAVAALFHMPPLPCAASHSLSLDVLHAPTSVKPCERFTARICLRNVSNHLINSHYPHPVQISSHWVDSHSREIVTFEGDRNPLVPALPPHSKRTYEVDLTSPALPGDYLVHILLVQEQVRWFDNAGADSMTSISVQVE